MLVVAIPEGLARVRGQVAVPECTHEGTADSPWEGWQVEGWPTTVILRGKVMVANGQLLGLPTDGQLIPRKIDPRVLRRAAF